MVVMGVRGGVVNGAQVHVTMVNIGDTAAAAVAAAARTAFAATAGVAPMAAARRC